VRSTSVRSKKGKEFRGVGGVTDKEAFSVLTINIIFQQQYFIARYLSSYVGNVFGMSLGIHFPILL
jgi:hypothetical protein